MNEGGEQKIIQNTQVSLAGLTAVLQTSHEILPKAETLPSWGFLTPVGILLEATVSSLSGRSALGVPDIGGFRGLARNRTRMCCSWIGQPHRLPVGLTLALAGHCLALFSLFYVGSKEKGRGAMGWYSLCPTCAAARSHA